MRAFFVVSDLSHIYYKEKPQAGIHHYVDTWKFKASQYDHVLGDYVRFGLSSRSRTVGGHLVQRDLYSAFLLWAALDDASLMASFRC